MPNYSPTVNPGDERRRTRFIGIRMPLGSVYAADVLEQDVVRVAEGEKVLLDRDGFGFSMDAAELAYSFPMRDPRTDAEIPGQTATTAQALAIIYSWVRAKQLDRDKTV